VNGLVMSPADINNTDTKKKLSGCLKLGTYHPQSSPRAPVSGRNPTNCQCQVDERRQARETSVCLTQ